MPGLSQATLALRPLALRRHGRILDMAEEATAEVEALLARFTRQLGKLLRSKVSYAQAGPIARHLAAEMYAQLFDRVRGRLERILSWQHRAAAAELAGVLTPLQLRVLAKRRGRPLRLDQVREDETAGQVAQLVIDLVFPLPDQVTIAGILFRSTAGLTWYQRLSALSRLASPEVIAGIVQAGFLRGATPQEIARDLRPAVQYVANSAKRIARTESLRVAHEMQMDAWAGLGDMAVGFQVHATLDERTRPWHRQRDKTIYYRDPRPGQKGMLQCPHPPLEAKDPAERPPGTPRVAYNCRCYLTPVMKKLNEPQLI